MFKIVKAELKKTFAKPGIFVLTAILIVVLFASALLYKPQVRDNQMVSLQSKISSVKEPTVSRLYEYFTSNQDEFGSNTKLGFDKEYTKIQDIVDFYYYIYYPDTEYGATINGENYSTSNIITVERLKQDYEDLDAKFKEYESKVIKDVGSTGNNRDIARENLRVSIKTLQNHLDQISKNSSKIVALIEEDTRKYLNDEVLAMTDRYLNTQESSFTNDATAYDNIVSLKFLEKIEQGLNSFIEYKPSQEVLDKCNEVIEEAKIRTEDYSNEITEYNDKNSGKSDDEFLKEFNLLVTKYKFTVKQCEDIVELSTKYDTLQQFSANQVTKYSAVKDIDLYQLQESLTKVQFLFDNNAFDFEYATPLSITQTSNDTANAYDFSYFALRLCAFIIIIYCVVLSAGSIAGEQQAGTFKLLAIRPYSRTKLFIGKMLSTIFMGFILLVVSVIATFIAGVIKFGTIASLPVLMIFNASNPIITSVFAEYLIALLTMGLELIFFVIMAYAISTIFKSNVGAVAISIFIYFASLILNTIAPTATFLRFLPFTNINLFKFFGSSFLSTQASSFLFAVLTPTVILGQNFIFSLLMSGVFALVILMISLIVFNKRDLR